MHVAVEWGNGCVARGDGSRRLASVQVETMERGRFAVSPRISAYRTGKSEFGRPRDSNFQSPGCRAACLHSASQRNLLWPILSPLVVPRHRAESRPSIQQRTATSARGGWSRPRIPSLLQQGRHGQLVGSAQTPRTAFDRPSARGRLRRRATAVPARAAVGRWQQRRYACRSASQGPPRSSCCNHRLVVAESPTCPPGHHGGEKRRRSRHGGAGDRPATPPVKPPRLPPDHGAASRG